MHSVKLHLESGLSDFGTLALKSRLSSYFLPWVQQKSTRICDKRARLARSSASAAIAGSLSASTVTGQQTERQPLKSRDTRSSQKPDLAAQPVSLGQWQARRTCRASQPVNVSVNQQQQSRAVLSTMPFVTMTLAKWPPNRTNRVAKDWLEGDYPRVSAQPSASPTVKSLCIDAVGPADYLSVRTIPTPPDTFWLRLWLWEYIKDVDTVSPFSLYQRFSIKCDGAEEEAVQLD